MFPLIGGDLKALVSTSTSQNAIPTVSQMLELSKASDTWSLFNPHVLRSKNIKKMGESKPSEIRHVVFFPTNIQSNRNLLCFTEVKFGDFQSLSLASWRSICCRSDRLDESYTFIYIHIHSYTFIYMILHYLILLDIKYNQLDYMPNTPYKRRYTHMYTYIYIYIHDLGLFNGIWYILICWSCILFLKQQFVVYPAHLRCILPDSGPRYMNCSSIWRRMVVPKLLEVLIPPQIYPCVFYVSTSLFFG